MPQYQGVWSLQQQMQALTSGQWATDPNFKNTTLLLQADNAANSAQNNTFLDSSTNAFAITRNGNTTQGSFSPFSLQPGAWGNYFDGVDDFLNFTTAAIGTNSFTIEAWIYLNSNSNYSGVFSSWSQTTGTGVALIFQNTGVLFAAIGNGGGGATTITGASPVSTNTWHHVAFVRNGSALTLYLNGISIGTATSSSNISQTAGVIGRYYNDLGNYYLNGYISNLRVVNGSAVYTSNFTPPTSPLTAITNTLLLTCQSNRFVDNSTNAYALTVNGTPSVQPFSPFAPQYQWTSDVIGGSGYFDGTGDYLSSTQSAYAPSGDFTVEAWFYAAPDFSGYGGICTNAASAGGTGWRLVLSPTPDTIGAWFNGTSFTNVAYKPGQWYHVALVRSGTSSNNVSFYINGVRQQQITDTTAVTSQSLVVGRYHSDVDNYYLKGYISAVRVVVGTAVYSGASFTLPTAPLTAVTNTKLLLNFTNAGIYDGTMKNNVETVGNAQISTSVVKYGSGSLSFAGATTDALWLASKPYFSTGTSDFTVEAWIRVNSLSAVSTVCGTRTAVNTTTGWNVAVLTDGSAQIYDNTGYANTGASSIAVNTWYHIAFVRINNVIYSYVNGVQRASTACTRDWTQSTFWVGNTGGSSEPMNGYIDDLRISRFARYTQNFIPPSVALPRQ